jgi:hypothetical protein
MKHSGSVSIEKAALIFIVPREVRTLRSETMGAAFIVLREMGQGSHATVACAFRLLWSTSFYDVVRTSRPGLALITFQKVENYCCPSFEFILLSFFRFKVRHLGHEKKPSREASPRISASSSIPTLILHLSPDGLAGQHFVIGNLEWALSR